MGRWRSLYSRAARDDPRDSSDARNSTAPVTATVNIPANDGANLKEKSAALEPQSVPTATMTAPPTTPPANGRKKDMAANNGVLVHNNGTHNGSGSGDAASDPLNPVTAPPALSPEYDDDPDGDPEELQCGLGPCAPRWLQIFASKQAFLATFCITWVLQGMYYTYFVSVITTIEKLFQIQSKTTGFIMSATEIGQIGSSLLLTYYGGQGHRPKWIAWGMVLFAVSSFTCSMPHFIFGQQLLHANDLLFSGVVSTVRSPYGDNSTESSVPPNICRARLDAEDDLPLWSNATLALVNGSMGARHSPRLKRCEEETGQVEQRIHSKITTIVLAIFFISLLGVGMGQTAVYTLGIPYIDDNVASRESPLYFAITIGVRILGPALGFILGSLCTRLYADLSVDPQITPNDPRWVGAWWLGLVLVSSMLMLASLAMFSFPKRLSSSRPQPKALRREKKNPSLRDFPKAVKRLLRNDILMCRTASSVLHILPIAGIYTFLPKYLESQFRMPAHAAAMISGVGGILVMGLGIIISGVFILRVKPNARFVAAWIAFTAFVYAIGMGVLMFIGCPMDDFAGLVPRDHGLPKFEPVCNTTCECDQDKFSPICGADGKTYYSACHAGCRNLTVVNGKIVEFSDCQCMYPNATGLNPGMSPANAAPGAGEFPAQAKIGYCGLQCSNFIWYILLFSLFVFIHSTSEVGSMLLILRCVDPRDKAMALGLIQFAIGLFGNVPCPIVYGAVVDSACLVWETACGKQGACWLYDVGIFRMFYHGTTGAIMLCAFFVDIVVWYKAGSINFVDEQAPSQEEELNPIAGKARSETSV